MPVAVRQAGCVMHLRACGAHGALTRAPLKGASLPTTESGRSSATPADSLDQTLACPHPCAPCLQGHSGPGAGEQEGSNSELELMKAAGGSKSTGVAGGLAKAAKATVG